MNRERRTVRSIEIESPIEVKFLDKQEHDVILCAENQAMKEIVDRTGGIDLKNDDNTVELLETVEEDSDQRVKRKIETKRVVSEDPQTKSRITKVTKTETTEVTKVYTIKTDEDVKRAALELGVSDMSLILCDGTTESKRHLHGSFTPSFQNEIVTPMDFANASQTDFVLISTGGETQKKETPESSRLASLCSCARRKKGATSQDVSKTEIKKKEQPISIRKRIQESARRMSAPKIEPLVNDPAKFVIKQQNLQLGTYIFDLMCKIGVYQSEAEKDRGRKVISRGLDLLYYDRCQSWPEFGQQLWLENEEYIDTNHVVSPTTNVIEYVFTNQQDLITLIDSIPDDELLAKIKDVAAKPVKYTDLKDSSEKASDIYHTVKKKLSVSRPQAVDKIQKTNEDVPVAQILSIIHDHERLSLDEGKEKLGEMGSKASSLPDTEKCKHICEIIEDTKHKSQQKPGVTSKPCLSGRCFSCFGDKKKEKLSATEQTVPPKMDPPTVQWPAITVGQASYDTPEILVNKRKLDDDGSIKIPAPFESITVDTSEVGPVSVKASTKIQDTHGELVAESETIIRPPGDDDDYVKIKLAETVDILAKGALTAAEMHTGDECVVAIKRPQDKTEPHLENIAIKRPQDKAEPHLENIRNIIDSHMHIPRLFKDDSKKADKREETPQKVSDIISAHGKFPQIPLPAITEKRPKNISDMIEYHHNIVEQTQQKKEGLSCTRCFSSKSPRKQSMESKKKTKKDLPDVIRSTDKPQTVTRTAMKTKIEAPLFHLPDIKLSGGHNIFIAHPECLVDLEHRLNQIFPGENADQLLNEILARINNDEPMDKIRSSLTGRYPQAMVDLVLLSMSFVQRDYDADLINDSQLSQALVQAFDENRPMYMQTQEERLQSPEKSTKARETTKRVSSKCFPCGGSERKVTVPMSPDCIELLNSLQQLPSSHLGELSSRVSERMRVCWNLDKTNATEASKIIRKILPRLRDGHVASLTVLRNELKDENPKYFYVVDPCVDVIQHLGSTHNLSQCSQPITDAEIDQILYDVGQNYAGVGLLSNSPFDYQTSWAIRFESLPDLVQSTEQRLIASSGDDTLTRKRRKLKKIIQDAFNLMARRQVSNTYDLRSQLHRLHPKDCAFVDLVTTDIEEGIRSGRLLAKGGRPSVRLLINILHSQDVESCRIQDGPNDRMLSDRAIGNLQRNRDLLVSSIKTLINESESDSLLNVRKFREDENVDNVIEIALNNLENVKSFDELTLSLKDNVRHESSAKLLSLLLEQAYFASELENPSSSDVIGLMRNRLHGKPLVLREICFALPDHTTIQCEEHMRNYMMGSGPGKLINVGQGLSWREANERARILFYRGKKPAVRYNDALEGFDVRMLLEQDGCIHEIPVSPNDVKKLLNSCGLYWDGMNILLLGKSDEILHRAEEEAFKILRETGFLHKTEEDIPSAQPENSS